MRNGRILPVRENSSFKAVLLVFTYLVLGVCLVISHHLYSEETGYKYFKNYSYKEYDHQAQNWGMVQAGNGIIYVANNGGVLEFDGVTWRVIGIPNYDAVRSIAMDHTGTVFIGGNNKIGYLAPDAKGTLKYQSLLDHLENNKKNFSYVWSIHATKQGIYFRTTKFLFRWDYKKMKTWSTPDSFKASFVCNGDFILQQQKPGLIKVVNDTFQLIPGSEIFVREKIWMMAPYDNDGNTRTMLIGTRSKGFYLYDGSRYEPFPTGVDDYLKENKSYQGIRLSRGDFALATLRGGLVIMDPVGRIKYILDKTSGLQDDKVHHVFEDMQGNLWLCLDNGISKIEYASPISIHDQRSHLSGLVLSVVKHGHDLYVGTTTGLYYLESQLKFRLIPGISSSCWSLVSTRGSVLAATTDGVFQPGDKKYIKRKVIKDLSYVLLPSKKDPARAWCGTASGLIALTRENDLWKEEHRYKTINREIRHIVEDKNGALWLVTSTGGVLKAEFPDDIHEPSVTWYETSHGLPGGRVYAIEAAGHVMFATEKGIFRFDEEKKVFIPDQTMGDEFAGGPEAKDVFRIAEDKNKHIWVHSQSRNYQVIPGTGPSFTIYSTPFLRIPVIQVNAIYPDPQGKTTWLASFDGLIRYDGTVKKNYRQPFQTLIRRVILNENRKNERLLFGGCENQTGKDGGTAYPIIEYQDRNLHFEFAACFYEAETETNYQCYLEGYDDQWSPWNKNTKRNYTNLDPGIYSFRVRARNIYEHMGREDVFRFKVLPPWYRTWWVYLLYGTGFFLVIFLVVKWRFNKLEQEKQKLEQTIRERTKEIQEKNRQLEEQTLQLKDQSRKLKEMDEIKSRFFANISHEFRTPLTLIMGPVEQMLSHSRDRTQKNTLNVMLKNTQRLLTLINQLLDLSRFDSKKMKLQAASQDIVPFLKGIVSSFQLVAQKNQLELEFHSENESITLYYDALKMEDVMQNLMINAVKFTPAGGKVLVSVFTDRREKQNRRDQPKKIPQAGFVNISVRDTGIGIPKEQLAQIFDRFYQAKGLREHQHKGTGIGLALIKENVLLHHGKIDVHSQEGKGTEFVIRLPLGHEHLERDEIIDLSAVPSPPRKHKEIETFNMITETDNETETETGTEAEANREAGEVKNQEQEKPIILVVEDHADVRKYICDSLRPGYTVIEAVDGKEGITKAREIIPDLIVSDIMMPEVDGYELCREIKRDIKTSHIPIILLTAKASEGSIIEGLETGADDYITKPFNTRILMTRIKNLIELRWQLQQKIQKQMLLQPAEISVSSMDQEFIKELQEVIEKNLSNTLFSVEKLGKKLYMSRATLYRKIYALTGESPREFIKSYRLKRGAQLLKSNFGNVNEVAFEVGFSNTSFFIKCFKEKFHQSPHSYKEVSKQRE
jgi:signal transduction histidine kinase/DNA-binding response OmpR family regulator